ncbi:MAG TPA: diheme cytochrome c-553 [Thermoanaerobaculia bacterium]|nr:diheme cytochrome c-553 [Thermoanaerobaculia bacterium]
MRASNFGKACAAIAAGACLVILAISDSSQAQTKAGEKSKAGQSKVQIKQVERGKYLVTIMSCNDCHTPFKMGPKGPEPDMSRMLSGHPEQMKLPPPPKVDMPWMGAYNATDTAFAGPWGVSYAANLTPDQNTGLGIWTEDMFLKAMKLGKHMGTSRDIAPPMPWNWVGKATDEDLKAIFAYLKSIPPIANHVPDYEPPKGPPPGAPAPPEKAAPKKK